jgi:hypothetical protein
LIWGEKNFPPKQRLWIPICYDPDYSVTDNWSG